VEAVILSAMSIQTGFRPRSEAERMSLVLALATAPRRIALGHIDDGWAAAHIWLWGRTPVWVGQGSKEAIDGVLGPLGLPPTETGAFDAVLRNDFSLDGQYPADFAPLPTSRDDAPLVTVLVCTYNRKELLAETLKSVALQSWKHELLVVDDGSSDGTWEFLAEQPQLRAIRQPKNQGKPSALNRGIKEARGDYLLVLDDDDLLVPGALHVLATALDRNPDLDMVWTDALIADHPEMLPKRWRTALRLSPDMNRLGVLLQIPATTGSVLIRTDTLRAVGPFVEGMHQGEDLDIFLRVAHKGRADGLPLATSIVRSHPGVRGPAAHAFKKQDAKDIAMLGMEWIAPVFRQRWSDAIPIEDRALSFAWGLGLSLRDSSEQAEQEIQRWEAPFTAREEWIRAKIGLASPDAARPECAVVVVDDSDPGGLELTLEHHADEGELWVSLEVPREPLDAVRLYWPGRYGAQRGLDPTWISHPGPWHLRLSSAPAWAPPPLSPDQRKLIPDLPAVDALLVLTAALNWPFPSSTRARCLRPSHPVTLIALHARAAIAASRPTDALGMLADPLGSSPQMLALWRIAADAFRGAGVEAEALACEERLR